eukprot:gene17822-biopygen26966
MWNQPHLVILDEPTNYLDRESLGALDVFVDVRRCRGCGCGTPPRFWMRDAVAFVDVGRRRVCRSETPPGLWMRDAAVFVDAGCPYYAD